MAISFRNRLLALFVLLLGIALFTSTWAVLRAVENNARANAERELFVAERVFDTLLDENRRQLIDRTALLAEDFAFRQAIATNEEDTIISALVNHGERISADMILLMNPIGEVLISTHELGSTLEAIREQIVQEPQPFSELTVAERKPFQLVMVPVMAPQLIAWVGVGFEIDSSLINSFRDITKANVSLLYHDSANSQTERLSTLNSISIDTGMQQAPTFADNVSAFTQSLAKEGWLNHETLLLNRPPQQLTLILSVSLQEAIAAYNNLQTQMLIIAFIVLVLATLASIFVAGSITRPIGTLVQAARRIAQGNYQQLLAIAGKSEFNELGDTLNQMQSDIQDREQRIRFQAQHDMVTGLPNRHYMAELFQHRLMASSAQPDLAQQFVSILIKITNFEALNDVYGLSIMDRILQRAASRLQNSTQQGDTLGLITTDEFLLLSSQPDPKTLQQSIAAWNEFFKQPFVDNEIEFTLNVRLGVVQCPNHSDNYEQMLRRSHIALSDARLQNHFYSIFQPEMEARYLRKLKVTQRLQQAISEQKFNLLFQPQYDLRTQTIHSAEALIRWHDDELGAVYPDEFIPLAESSGDITLITDWVFAEALAQLARWREAGFNLGVSINLSAKDILKDDFIDRVVTMIQCQDVNPTSLMLEVTESAFVEDMDHALKNLQRLYDVGVHLAMDDFGTGFSSLAQLKVMPVHELKVDKSFVLNLDKDEDDQKIVRSTIEMAHHLGLTVIAEGVENNSTLELLIGMHCDAIQGYFLSKPMSSQDLIHWLTEFSSQQLEPTHAQE